MKAKIWTGRLLTNLEERLKSLTGGRGGIPDVSKNLYTTTKTCEATISQSLLASR